MRYSALVKEVMNRSVKTISPGDSIKKAAEMLKKNKIGSVVVVGKKGVAGILTPSDIVYKHVASRKGKKVSDIMTKNPVTISPNKTLEEAARLLTQKGIEKLLVFKNKKLIGIITNNDILRVEPALFEIMLEKMKIGSLDRKEEPVLFDQCESCGNYSDNLKKVSGSWLCEECRG